MEGLDILIARRKAGLRQYELANRLAIPETALSRIETGRRAIPQDLIPKLRDVLGANLAGQDAANDNTR